MSRSISDLRELTDAQLIAEHDELATNTFVGTGYYLGELERRSRQRSADSSELLARRVFVLSIVTLAVSILALGAAVASLLMSR